MANSIRKKRKGKVSLSGTKIKKAKVRKAKVYSSQKSRAKSQVKLPSKRKSAKRRDILTKEEKLMIRRINYRRKKTGQGRLLLKKMRDRKKEYGKDFRSALNNNLLHANHFAYPSFIAFVVANYKDDFPKAMARLRKMIRSVGSDFRYSGSERIDDTKLQQILNEIYDLMKEIQLLSGKEREKAKREADLRILKRVQESIEIDRAKYLKRK